MLNIAIDGPSGAGKTTVSRIIAKRLNILYLDTGAMYRAVAVKAKGLGVSTADEEGVLSFIDDTKIDIKYIDGMQHIFIDGGDVTRSIREHSISKDASDISKIVRVRERLVELQREIAQKNDIIVDGRDIGTFVLPDASFKFFLTADIEVRAKRRFRELSRKEQQASYETVLNDIAARDKNDRERSFAPLKRAEDAFLIDSTYLNVGGVVSRILNIIRKRSGR
jgi:cytidylate kinase